jgi:radial spoke head protein 1
MGDEEESSSGYVGDRDDEGEREGQGVATFADGATYDGAYVAGIRHGAGEYTFANGDKYVGQYKDGLRDGTGVLTYADGSKYNGRFKMGRRHGQGDYTYACGDCYSGTWAGGAKHGLGLYFFRQSKSQFYGYWVKNGFSAGTWRFLDGTTLVGKFQGKPMTIPKVWLIPSDCVRIFGVSEGAASPQLSPCRCRRTAGNSCSQTATNRSGSARITPKTHIPPRGAVC